MSEARCAELLAKVLTSRDLKAIVFLEFYSSGSFSRIAVLSLSLKTLPSSP